MLETRENKATRFYLLAAQCHGLNFTSALHDIIDENSFIMGLASGATYVTKEGSQGLKQYALHLEVDEHLRFIRKMEDYLTRMDASR